MWFSSLSKELGRPDPDEWIAHSNAGDPDDIAAYKEAARRIGVRISVGYPVPCPADASLCAQLGMKGIYIARAHADRSDALTMAKHGAKSEMSR